MKNVGEKTIRNLGLMNRSNEEKVADGYRGSESKPANTAHAITYEEYLSLWKNRGENPTIKYIA